jgi:hypothetical protein
MKFQLIFSLETYLNIWQFGWTLNLYINSLDAGHYTALILTY